MAEKQETTAAKLRLLEAAATLFAEKSFAAVSVREICSAAGTGNNMLHHYFGSKQGIQDAVLEQFSSEVFSVPIRIIEKLPQNKAEFVSRFELFVEETLEALIANRSVFVMIMRDELTPKGGPFDHYSQSFIGFLERGIELEFVNKAINPLMLTGLVMDRLSNQVLHAKHIKSFSGDCILSDTDYRQRWLRANLDLFLHGFIASS